MAKYGVQGFPTCLVLNADGALLREVGNVVQPAEILAATRECGDAEADFQAFRASVEKHDEPALWAALAEAYGQRRQFTQAVAVLERLATRDPSPRRWKALAKAQLGADDSKAALATYDKLLALEPTLDNRFLKAEAQLRGGDQDGALAGLKGALEKADDAAKADGKSRIAGLLLGHIIRLCNEARDFKGALKPLDMLLNEYGDTQAANQARRFAGQVRQMAGG